MRPPAYPISWRDLPAWRDVRAFTLTPASVRRVDWNGWTVAQAIRHRGKAPFRYPGRVIRPWTRLLPGGGGGRPPTAV